MLPNVESKMGIDCWNGDNPGFDGTQLVPEECKNADSAKEQCLIIRNDF